MAAYGVPENDLARFLAIAMFSIAVAFLCLGGNTMMKNGPAFGVLLAALTSAPANASEIDAAALTEYCQTTMKASAGICDCLLRQFAKLSDAQQALLGAVLRDDEAALEMLHTALSPADAQQVDGFLARESLLCRPSG
jgi:hypothetical protein